jgi:septum formation protein
MLILGSSSPARLEILTKLGITPKLVLNPEINETPLKKETPKLLSLRLAKLKGLKIAEKYPQSVVISADTVVCVGRRIIDKCHTKEDVINAMKLLSGRSHIVYTSVCVTFNGSQRVKTSKTRIKFKRLTIKEIQDFANTEEGIGKAGGYTLNGFAESFVLQVSGSVSGVIGLPSYELLTLLKPVESYYL